jgi:hypothetical protein
MSERGYDRGALLGGLLFIVTGLAFVLDRLDVWTVPSSYIWPLVLIFLGAAVLLGGRPSKGGDQQP